ncbi:hypothetical protein HY229_00480 [Candidatus Acetothermia bacterium]|nr:hypothetical protein [Candidatus Acetothermia bacterium]MBI3642568.1 hypothetical protein [Candidatus Acetothermia bacterium]
MLSLNYYVERKMSQEREKRIFDAVQVEQALRQRGQAKSPILREFAWHTGELVALFGKWLQHIGSGHERFDQCSLGHQGDHHV